MTDLTHIDREGNAVMVDVSEKGATSRTAMAEGLVLMAPGTLDLIEARGFKKGDVLGIAQLAGIMGAKRTSDLIPLCHPLPLSAVKVELEPDRAAGGVRIRATCRVSAQTGVEMEALTAVAVAGLALHDMIKAVDPAAVLDAVRLVRKEGGKHGTWTRPEDR